MFDVCSLVFGRGYRCHCSESDLFVCVWLIAGMWWVALFIQIGRRNLLRWTFDILLHVLILLEVFVQCSSFSCSYLQCVYVIISTLREWAWKGRKLDKSWTISAPKDLWCSSSLGHNCDVILMMPFLFLSVDRFCRESRRAVWCLLTCIQPYTTNHCWVVYLISFYAYDSLLACDVSHSSFRLDEGTCCGGHLTSFSMSSSS